jgi:hypothetical protein
MKSASSSLEPTRHSREIICDSYNLLNSINTSSSTWLNSIVFFAITTGTVSKHTRRNAHGAATR